MKFRMPCTFYTRKNSKGRKIWYFRVWDDRRHIRVARTTGCTSFEKAKKYAYEFMADPEKMNDMLHIEKPKVLTFKEYAKDWWIWDKCPYVLARRNRGTEKHPGIKKSYAGNCRMWTTSRLIPFFGKYTMDSITPELIEKFFGLLKNKYKLSPKTINNVRSVLMIMFKEAVIRGNIEKNPVERTLQRTVERKKTGRLSEEEAMRILDRDMIDFYWNGDWIAYGANYLASQSGLRIGEILALKVDYLHPTYIFVSKNYSRQYGEDTTKNSEDKIIPITQETRELLLYLYSMNRTGTSYIFASATGTPVAEERVRDKLYAAMEKIGISEEERIERNIKFRSWRNFFITRCQKLGVSPSMIRAITGHLTASMTDHYTNYRPEELSFVADIESRFLTGDFSPEDDENAEAACG